MFKSLFVFEKYINQIDYVSYITLFLNKIPWEKVFPELTIRGYINIHAFYSKQISITLILNSEHMHKQLFTDL